MNTEYTQFVATLLKRLAKLNYIKPGEVPNIDLYMDQVTTFMDEHLSDCKRRDDDKILTKTMINNYTKNTATGKKEIFQGAFICPDIYLLL